MERYPHVRVKDGQMQLNSAFTPLKATTVWCLLYVNVHPPEALYTAHEVLTVLKIQVQYYCYYYELRILYSYIRLYSPPS